MRIIAGKYRGRRLRALRGQGIRPTAERLREAIFNILGPGIAGENVIDIFAGTGAMGIEALSRGAGHAVFIDKHPAALDCLRTNITPLEVANQWDIIRWDAGANLRCLAALDRRFGCAFIDPPYNKGLVRRTLNNLVASAVMRPDGLIVIEHHQQERIEPLDDRIALRDQRRYGKTLVTFLSAMV